LLHRGQVVSGERLVDELWGERAPATAAKALQGYASHLRKALGPEVLLTRGRGYVLVVVREQLDAERFAALATEANAALTRGDAACACALLDDALGLWRGEPLGDLSYEPFAAGELDERGATGLVGRERLGLRAAAVRPRARARSGTPPPPASSRVRHNAPAPLAIATTARSTSRSHATRHRFSPSANLPNVDFFSARIGCQVYGLSGSTSAGSACGARGADQQAWGYFRPRCAAPAGRARTPHGNRRRTGEPTPRSGA
jgi:biotin operon repressor